MRLTFRRGNKTKANGNGSMASSATYAPSRLDVYLVDLNPTVGSEIQKTRPCVVVSPDEANLYLATVIIVPMTTGRRDYPTRIACRFQDKDGAVALDHIRSVDRTRLVKRLGRLSQSEGEAVLFALSEFFAP